MNDIEKTCQTCRCRFTECKLREAITISQEYRLDTGFNDDDQHNIAQYLAIEDFFKDYKEDIVNFSNLSASAKDVAVEDIVKTVMQAVGKYCVSRNRDAKQISFDFKLPPDFYCNFWE